MEVTYRSITKRRMHTTLYFSPYLTTTPSSIEIVNWEIFIPNLNWTKNTFYGKKSQEEIFDILRQVEK